MGSKFDELAEQSDALLQGRRTYQVSAAAWPSRSGDPFIDWINRVQKYVVSDTLPEKDATWNPTMIIRGTDFLRTVSELRARPGGYIYLTHGARDCANGGVFPRQSPVWAAQEPGCRYVVIPDAGHTAHMDNPAAFNTVLLDFLRQHVPPSIGAN
jgi:pimeloyl-ACP methyl ester carboxylesterase